MINKFGLYDPMLEKDACGVGIVANIKGQRSHEIIQQGIHKTASRRHFISYSPANRIPRLI